jgi:hypothetical protein
MASRIDRSWSRGPKAEVDGGVDRRGSELETMNWGRRWRPNGSGRVEEERQPLMRSRRQYI